MKLLNLPTELIVFIFERVPVTDLVLYLPLTCSQFSNLIHTACNRRISLSLIFGKDNILGGPIANKNITSMKGSFVTPLSSIDTLRYTEVCALSRAFLRKIVTKFPNVRALQLNAVDIFASQLKQAVADTLLQGLLTKLEALHLILLFEHSNFHRISEQSILDSLYHTLDNINRMHILRRLVFSTWEQLGVIELPILGQFREFYFHSLDYTDTLYESVLKYGASNRELKRIGLLTRTATDSLFTKDILVSNKVKHSITHLALCDFSNSLTREERILVQMKNLKALTIHWNRTRPLQKAIQIVAQLKLDYLKISIEHLNFDDVPPMLNLSSLAANCRIDSMKTVSLNYNDAPSHESLWQFNFDKLFPNLKLIYIYTEFANCPTCQYTFVGHSSEDEDYVEKRARCIKLAVQPLQKMNSKPKIEFHYYSQPRQRRFRVYL